MQYIIHLLNLVCLYSLLAMSLNIIVGSTGIPAFGHAAFFMIGAYCSALLALKLNVSPFVGFWIGGMAAAIAGLIVAYPAEKLKGDYLALATFGFGIIAYNLCNNLISFTNGPMGLPDIPVFSLGSILFNNVYIIMPIFVLITFLVYRFLSLILSRPYGRVLYAIRDDEIAAQSLGKNTNRVKTEVIVLGAFVAGLTGSLFAHYITFIDPSSFTMMDSLTILLIVIFGGLGSLKGSILSAFILVLFPELLRFIGLPSTFAAQFKQIIYGIFLIVVLIYRPQGIMGKYKWK